MSVNSISDGKLITGLRRCGFCRLGIVVTGLISFGFAGCSHDVGLMKMDEALSSYGTAIRWGRYQTAMDFIPPQNQRGIRLENIMGVRVTGYDPVYRSKRDDGKTVVQTVEIHYLRPPELVEKSIVDQQAWLYDEEEERWFLTSGLPVFQ